MRNRYLVFRAGDETGLGHTLTSILSYAHFCKTNGRILALDLRDFKYLDMPQSNFFQHFSFVGSGWPAIEMDSDVIDDLYRSPDRADYPYEEDLVQSILSHPRATTTNLSNVIVFPSRYCDWLPDFDNFPLRIALRGLLAKRLNLIKQQYFDATKVIGIHFRHGNGEYLDGRYAESSPHFASTYIKVLNDYADKIQKLVAKEGIKDYRVFVCSDNQQFREDIKGLVPNAFYVTDAVPGRPHVSFDRETNLSAFSAAVIDLWCLSACDFIVNSWSSFARFAYYNTDEISDKRWVPVPIPHLRNTITAGLNRTIIEDTLTVRLGLRNAPVTFRAYANILEIADDLTSAEIALKRSQALEFYENAVWQKSLWLMASFDINDAITAVSNEAAKLDNPFLWAHLADLLFISGKHRAAEAAITKAIDLDPGWPWFRSILSKFLAVQGKLTSAVQVAQYASRLVPTSLLLQERLRYLETKEFKITSTLSEDSRPPSYPEHLGLSFFREPGFFV